VANKNFSQFPSTGAPTGQRGPRHDKVKEGTMNWPDVPGKTQPKDRSNGIKKCKGHAVSKGI
jgi:hypothetical protein